MKASTFSMLDRALTACTEKRDCLLRIDGHSFRVRSIEVPPGEEVVVTAELEDGCRFIFDPDQLAAVTIGARTR